MAGPISPLILPGMNSCPAAIQGLVDHVEAVSVGRSTRRRAAGWATRDPLLADCRSPADLAQAIRSARPGGQDRLVAALVGLADGDDLAQLTVVAGLSRRLGWIVAGWRRSGVAPAELAVLESDLVSECWAAVASAARDAAQGGDLPPSPAMALVQSGWDRVRAPRRRMLRAQARTVTDANADRAGTEAPAVPAGEELAAVIVSSLRSGQVSVTGARLVYATRVAGWSVTEMADRLGCSPQSVRTRRARAEQRLAAA